PRGIGTAIMTGRPCESRAHRPLVVGRKLAMILCKGPFTHFGREITPNFLSETWTTIGDGTYPISSLSGFSAVLCGEMTGVIHKYYLAAFLLFVPQSINKKREGCIYAISIRLLCSKFDNGVPQGPGNEDGSGGSSGLPGGPAGR